MKFKKIVFCLLILCVFGQVFAQEDKKLPIQYKISLGKSDKKKKTLSVILNLKNISNETIIIDKNFLSYRVTFQRLSKKMADGSVTDGEALMIMGHSISEYKGDFLSLLPNQSYKKERIFTLSGDFFEEDTNYKLSFTYGQFSNVEFNNQKVWRGIVESNEIKIRL